MFDNYFIYFIMNKFGNLANSKSSLEFGWLRGLGQGSDIHWSAGFTGRLHFFWCFSCKLPFFNGWTICTISPGRLQFFWGSVHVFLVNTSQGNFHCHTGSCD